MTARAGAGGSDTEVNTEVIIMLYEALRSVLRNPSEAPASLLISVFYIAISIRSTMGLGIKKSERNPQGTET